ncbi:MAG: signal peptide peptidase SppA [Phycisphaerae bacterium]
MTRTSETGRNVLAHTLMKIACALTLMGAGCVPSGGFKITPMPSDQSLKERIVYRHPGWVSNRIAVIDISGILMNAHTPGLLSEGEHPVSLTVEKLAAAARDKRVKAVVLRINSPGGTVTASDILYQEIQAFKEKTGKPVVACFMDVAASGAYYLACASDEIVARRTAVTGSIGVIMQMINVSGTMAKIGLTADAITSGPMKDAGSPFRKMRPEERELLQKLVDGFYQQFVDAVAAGRGNLTREEVLSISDGRVYSAKEALEVGLIDRIGTLQDAVAEARRRAGIEAAHTVMYHRPLAWAPNIYSAAPVSSPRAVNFFNFDLSSLWTAQPRFMYIWNLPK